MVNQIYFIEKYNNHKHSMYDSGSNKNKKSPNNNNWYNLRAQDKAYPNIQPFSHQYNKDHMKYQKLNKKFADYDDNGKIIHQRSKMTKSS